MDTTTALILLLIATLLIHLAEEIKMGFRKRLPDVQGGYVQQWTVG